MNLHVLVEKWRREAAEYPAATDERAHAAAVAVRLCADELSAALAPPPTCGTWQPIETAPKDGTAILVADEKSVEMGVWQEATDDEVDSGVVVLPGFEAGWWGSEWQPGANQPTHWMPLPDAPTEPTR